MQVCFSCLSPLGWIIRSIGWEIKSSAQIKVAALLERGGMGAGCACLREGKRKWNQVSKLY
jgi:hypothetical protein